MLVGAGNQKLAFAYSGRCTSTSLLCPKQVLEKLSLGANEKQASMSIIRASVKTGMSPSIDSTKTVGLVSLPGMMSGLIFAGVEPTEAIRYQIVVMFMIIAVTSIASFSASYLAYRQFYNEQKQLTL